MLGAHALGEAALQLLDGIFQIDLRAAAALSGAGSRRSRRWNDNGHNSSRGWPSRRRRCYPPRVRRCAEHQSARQASALRIGRGVVIVALFSKRRPGGRTRRNLALRAAGACLKWSSIFSTRSRQASCSRGPAGLLDRDLEIAELALDLVARQHMQPARQDRRLDHGRLRAVEALEGRVARLDARCGNGSAGAARLPPPRRPRARHGRARRRAPRRGCGSPACVGQSRLPVRQPAKISTSSVKLATAKGLLAEIVERGGGAERRDDPVLAQLGDEAEGRDMHLPLPALGW